MTTPIKRHISIQSLSREHHHGLLLCWKIRTGISKCIEAERIKKYTDWFYENHLMPHFEVEEKYIFPILGNKNELVRKALKDHRRLKRLFENKNEVQRYISLIEEELENHIRFEERVLFNKIQEKATEKELAFISLVHKENKPNENWNDDFWI